MPLPKPTSENDWYWHNKAPASATQAFAVMRPRHFVRMALMEEERTISSLSPVARISSPCARFEQHGERRRQYGGAQREQYELCAACGKPARSLEQRE